MTPTQRLVSCLLVAHMVALFIAAIPGLDDFATEPVIRGESEAVTPVTAAFDAAAVKVVWLHRAVWSSAQPLQRLTNPYVQITSQYQIWNMFSNPARSHEQLRIGYRLSAVDGTTHTEFEHVFPAGPPNLKLVSAYFDSFPDKALAAGIENYRRLVRAADASGKPPSEDDVMRTLRPFTRYYASRRIAAGLPPGTRLDAVEFWSGTSPMSLPPPLVVAAAQPDPEPAIAWQRWVADDLK